MFPLSFGLMSGDIHSYYFNNIKQVRRIISRVGIAAMLFTFYFILINIREHLIVSAVLDSAIFISLAISYWLYFYKRKINFASTITIICVNTFLFLLSFAEGRNSGSFLYHIPLLFAIPFMVINDETYKSKLIFSYSITITAGVLAILIAPDLSIWQDMDAAKAYYALLTNSVACLLLTTIFSIFIIYTERNFIRALYREKVNAEEQKFNRTLSLSKIGHELRTHLNGINGATTLLTGQDISSEAKPYLNVLEYCTKQMLFLVNDILDINKIEAGELKLNPSETNLKDLLLQSILPFADKAAEKKIDLNTAIDEQLHNHWVMIDEARLLQVIDNLLSNALKFTDKGSIELAAEIICTDKESMQVKISVTDTGIGIDKENYEMIYKSFWQVSNENIKRYGGTGLGLTIAQSILGIMGSELTVESTPGRGSRFYFTLTLPVINRVNKNIQQEENKNERFNFAGKRILIAEDNPVSLMVATKMLQMKNAEVIKAVNGLEALKELKNNKADLILLDLEMPEMNGYTAIVKIKSDYPSLPVIAFTANIPDEDLYKKISELGFDDMILKPFTQEHLYEKISRHIFGSPKGTPDTKI